MFSDNDEPLTLTGNQISHYNQKADGLFSGPQIDFANKARLINARQNSNGKNESILRDYQHLTSMQSANGMNHETNLQ